MSCRRTQEARAHTCFVTLLWRLLCAGRRRRSRCNRDGLLDGEA